MLQPQGQREEVCPYSLQVCEEVVTNLRSVGMALRGGGNIDDATFALEDVVTVVSA